jgi:Cys-rich protein (TIGR01571 family)
MDRYCGLFLLSLPQANGDLSSAQATSASYGSTSEFGRLSEGTPFMSSIGASDTLNRGAWKDGVFDCCRYGPCHPSLWHALCCPQILMAQVLTRLKMNWAGNRASEQEYRKTFRVVLAIVGTYWILTIILSPDISEEDTTPALQYALYQLVGCALTIYTLVVLTKLRSYARMLFGIPIRYRCFGDCEDCCLSFWCSCCTVSQLARQTCDYDEQQAACWTPNGLRAPSTLDATSTLTV